MTEIVKAGENLFLALGFPLTKQKSCNYVQN